MAALKILRLLQRTRVIIASVQLTSRLRFVSFQIAQTASLCESLVNHVLLQIAHAGWFNTSRSRSLHHGHTTK